MAWLSQEMSFPAAPHVFNALPCLTPVSHEGFFDQSEELVHNQAQEDYTSGQEYLKRWRSWQMEEPHYDATTENSYFFSTDTLQSQMQVPSDYLEHITQISPSSSDISNFIVHTSPHQDYSCFYQSGCLDMSTYPAALDLSRKKQKLILPSPGTSSRSKSNTSSSTISHDSVEVSYPSAKTLKSDEVLSSDQTVINESWIPPVVFPHSSSQHSSNQYQVLNEEKPRRVIALNTNLKPRARQGSANDPQSIAARHRRERISDRLKILQELVPNSAKVDLVTMLEKAINYVKFLQLQLKVLSADEYWPEQVKKGVIHAEPEPEPLVSRFMVPVQ